MKREEDGRHVHKDRKEACRKEREYLGVGKVYVLMRKHCELGELGFARISHPLASKINPFLRRDQQDNRL